MKFCSEECQSLAEVHYHTALCGKDFKEFYKSARSSVLPEASRARVNLVFLRFMAICVQGKTHPLKHHFIACLSANYDAQVATPWTDNGHIVGPNKILQTLGVDIF